VQDYFRFSNTGERCLLRGCAAIVCVVVDEAAAHNPGAWWWLKADGCDVNKGLKESAKLKWSGDVDLSDGSLQTV